MTASGYNSSETRVADLPRSGKIIQWERILARDERLMRSISNANGLSAANPLAVARPWPYKDNANHLWILNCCEAVFAFRRNGETMNWSAPLR